MKDGEILSKEIFHKRYLLKKNFNVLYVINRSSGEFIKKYKTKKEINVEKTLNEVYADFNVINF